MCICDDKYFRTVNTITGHVKLYKRAVSVAKRFDCSRDFVFRCLNRDPHIRQTRIYHGNTVYNVEVNKHPECIEFRNDYTRKYGVRLGKIPDRLRHLLPEGRQ